MLRGGIYFLNLFYYNDFTLKIGCSQNFDQRLEQHRTLF